MSDKDKMGATKKDKKIQRAFAQLQEVYRKIPDTKGCMENINKPQEEGGCGAWCCQIQNPHVLYSEFLQTWAYVLKNWTFDEIGDLLEACVRNYLTTEITKGCVFFDKEKKMCKQHHTRPFNCRVYGITPEEEMAPRIARLRVLYKGKAGADIRDQCKLVETVDGSKFTSKKSDELWKELSEIEEGIGIKKRKINDRPGGTYLTYHDHILMHVFPDVVLKKIQLIRQYGNSLDREIAVRAIIDNWRKGIDQRLNEKISSVDASEVPIPNADNVETPSILKLSETKNEQVSDDIHKVQPDCAVTNPSETPDETVETPSLPVHRRTEDDAVEGEGSDTGDTSGKD